MVTMVLSNAARIETGKFTGDGTTSQPLNLADPNLTPIRLKIWPNITADDTDIEYLVFTSDDYLDEHGAGMAVDFYADNSQRNQIIAFAKGSFTVDDGGEDAHPNKNGQVYQYEVIGV